MAENSEPVDLSDSSNSIQTRDFYSPNFSMEAIQHELDELGWTVIENALPPADCDRYIEELDDWMKSFGSEKFPANKGSCIHKYKVAFSPTAWGVRLQTKPVFAKLWGTDKLLTSTDGLGIGEPPENAGPSGHTFIDESGLPALHHDQGPQRQGLHNYQGAVYLDEQTEDDWCFYVLEKSHNYHEEFFQDHARNPYSEFRLLEADDATWYSDRGCKMIRTPVPKGAIILWDSRTVHAGAPPREGRKNAGRWRHVVFVCMGPAIWASNDDMAAKRESYQDLRITRHWPSNGVSLFPSYYASKRHDFKEMPEVAKSHEARLLAGVEEYDFGDGQSNGPTWKPEWRDLS